MSDEKPILEQGFWPKIDPVLRRVGILVGIATALLAILVNYIIPYFNLFITLASFLLPAWYIYRWKKQRTYLAIWSMPYVMCFNMLLWFNGARVHLNDPAPYEQTITGVEILLGVVWGALLLLSAYERHRFWYMSLEAMGAILKLQFQTSFMTMKATCAIAEKIGVEEAALYPKEVLTVLERVKPDLDVTKSLHEILLLAKSAQAELSPEIKEYMKRANIG